MTTLSGSPVTKGVALTTTANTAYDMMKQGGRLEGEYELVSCPPGGPLPSKYLEGMHEVPSPPPSRQPLPTIPLPLVTPTSLNVGRAEEERVIYEHIPGDK